MARANSLRLPQQNPCAQCGKPISMPEWIELGPGCATYLWRCFACDYRFEAIAYFDEGDGEALAA